jgi:thiamine kinase-like enzyme
MEGFSYCEHRVRFFILYIIDWEMSGSGDVFFDLATIPFSCKFSEEQEKEWLK